MQPTEPAVTGTRLIYAKDSYVRDFEAQVVAVQGSAVALDQTALYPGGGGQMADRGHLLCSGATLPVVAYRKQGEVVWHELAPEAAVPPVGARVQGAVDWDFRYQMMRTHTALHLLCGLIFTDYGAQVTGGQMYPDRARMDFSIDSFTPDLVRAIEQRVNDAIQADAPIRVYKLPREEAMAIPDLIRTKINLLPPAIQEIRIVEIVGIDLQADGGTHVHKTSEVGGIRVVKVENKGKQNKRMEITLVDADEIRSDS